MFSSTGLSPSTTGRSRPLRLTPQFLTVGRSGRIDNANPTTLHTQPLPGITRTKFGLIRFRSPLLTESLLFSLPVGTEMFHFPTFPPHTLYIQMRVTRHHSCWVSPFGHPRITARLTAPRGLSQPPTSFIGSWCQGIHRTLFITYNKDARVHCAILKQHTQPGLTAAPATPQRKHGMTTIRILYMSCLERNTRVFSQDPTVHRYNSRSIPSPTSMGGRQHESNDANWLSVFHP